MSQPHDPAEQEADRVAEKIMRMPQSPRGPRTAPARGQEPVSVRRKPESTAPPAVDAGFAARLGPGSPLLQSARDFFEPRFGHDFRDVRVHTGAGAAAATRAVRAYAFTLGHDVAFAAGEYDPQSARGRGLLAHELAHVVQQRGAGMQLQRRLTVDPTPPADTQDPLSSMTVTAFQSLAFSEMNAIVHSLCDRFSVNSAGDVVTTPADACNDLDAVSGGAKPVGCCCLCALTAAGSGPWTIHVTGLGGPRTVPGATGGDFFLHPRTPASGFEFGAWDVTGARQIADPVVVAGHELCGHGALMERGIHPASVERVDTDVHDPTVRIENLIHAEQGLPGADRALAAGPHRGESFARITVRNYAFNGSSVPASEAHKVQLAKDFINANDTWVDIFGHSDLVGSPSAKLAVSQARADNMRTTLTSGTRPVSPTISKTFSGTGTAGTGTVTVSGNRFTRVEGRSDFDAIPGAAAADLRRVDVVMPTRPAGAEVPSPGTPTTVAPVGPQSLLTFLRRRFFGNACDRRLAKGAWF